MSHNNLQNYYRTMFGLMHHHHYDMAYIDSLMIWEKDIIVGMLMEANKK